MVHSPNVHHIGGGPPSEDDLQHAWERLVLTTAPFMAAAVWGLMLSIWSLILGVGHPDEDVRSGYLFIGCLGAAAVCLTGRRGMLGPWLLARARRSMRGRAWRACEARAFPLMKERDIQMGRPLLNRNVYDRFGARYRFTMYDPALGDGTILLGRRKDLLQREMYIPTDGGPDLVWTAAGRLLMVRVPWRL